MPVPNITLSPNVRANSPADLYDTQKTKAIKWLRDRGILQPKPIYSLPKEPIDNVEVKPNQ